MLSRPLKLFVQGEMGEGKSTFLNLIAKSTNFKAGSGFCAVTQEISDAYPTNFEGYHLELHDSPGLNDDQISLQEWHRMLVKKCPKIDVLCFVRRIDARVSGSALFGFDVMQSILKEFEPGQTIFVLTHCDTLPPETDLEVLTAEMQQEYRRRFNLKSLPKVLHTDNTSDSVLPLRNLLAGVKPMTVRTTFDQNLAQKQAQSIVGKEAYIRWEENHKAEMQKKIAKLEEQAKEEEERKKRQQEDEQKKLDELRQANNDMKDQLIDTVVEAGVNILFAAMFGGRTGSRY
mmetsp:Transcript_21328/g.24165  ORF Transcript_21328/g.24165 Transcript_21328/m.24165 type:complete len:288 (+) Transcript_21328:271-1134(+)